MKRAPLARGALLVAALAAATAFACGVAPEEDVEDGAGAQQVSEATFYGDDRVGDVLRGKPELVPADFPTFEKLFAVGRACARADSKEIFVVEEEQTRLAGVRELHEVTTTKLMPRAVVTGCNTRGAADPSGPEQSFSLMAALISDPGMHAAAQGDTMRMWPLEVMALDRKTGLYNFYLFEPAVTPQDPFAELPAGTKGRVTRVYRAVEKRPGLAGTGEWNVFQRRLEAGRGVTAEAQPIGGGNRCFNCHVDGAPLLNEVADPWRNWVSSKQSMPSSAMAGVTKSLVDEAVPNPTTGRASLANDLEPIMRAAVSRYVSGTGRNGWARATLAGDLPGGLTRALESVFCQTEVNYASADESYPIEMFLDPSVASAASLVPPSSYGDDRVAFQVPVRGMRDKATERWLVDNGYLSAATEMAIRLVDDERDIFSATRCGLLAKLGSELPATDPTQVHDRIRATVLAEADALPFAATQPKRLAYLKALLTPGIRRDVALREYLAELAARWAGLDQSERAIKATERERKRDLRAMYPRASNPMPRLDP